MAFVIGARSISPAAEAHPGAVLRTLQIGMTATPMRGGGLDRYYFNLLHALPEHRIGVSGLVAGDLAVVGKADGVESFAPDSFPLLRRWFALRRSVTRLVPQVDLVVSHFAPYAFPVLDRFRDRPFIVHFHGSWALESAGDGAGRFNVAAKGALERKVFAVGRRFVVLSRAFGSILERKFSVAPEAIRVVPGGVDLRRFTSIGSRDEARRALGWQLDRPTVLTACRLVRAKGLEAFIDAVDVVRRAVPDVQVAIAGTGPLASELARRVDEGGLNRWVRFVGHLSDDLPLAYRAADLFVVPTTALEGFGLVVVEALACGTQVLVTPVGGLPEVVTGLNQNLILEGTDANAIARGVIEALHHRSRLPDEDACARYAQRFGWPQIAAQVAKVYKEST